MSGKRRKCVDRGRKLGTTSDYRKTIIRCHRCSVTGIHNPMAGKVHSEQTRELLRKKALEQFKNGVSVEMKQKIMKGHHKRTIASMGHKIFTHGYVFIKIGKQKYIGYHRFKVEKYLGKKLEKGVLVHHIDGNKSNNNLSNLYIFTKREVHLAIETLISNGYIKYNFLKSNLKKFKLTGLTR